MKHKLAVVTIIICLLCAVCLGIFSACEKEADFTIWAPQEEQVNLPKMIEAFKEEYPEYADVKIAYKVMGVDNSITELKKDSEAAADVFLFPSGGITELTAAGLILPINISESEMKAQFTDNAVESVKYNDQFYGIPVTLNTFIMYYNAQFYNEEEIKSLNTMMDKDLGSGVANFSLTINDSWYLSTFFLTQPNSLTAPTADTIKCTFNDANGFKVGKYLIDLVKNPRFFAADGSGSDGDRLEKKTLAALCSGTWSAKNIAANLGDDYRAAPLPKVTIDGEEYDMANFGDYKAYGVNSATKDAKLANLIAKWLGNGTCQTMRYNASGDAPTNKSLTKLEAVQTDKAVIAALAQENICTQQPKTSKLSGYWDSVKAFGEELLAGKITEENLQQKLDQMVENIQK